MPLLGTDAPPLQDIDGWINGEVDSLEDGLYLLDFWTYTCVNCVRMLPLIQLIAEEYPEVQVVGVHTPEFDFEQERENVERAVEKYRLDYPIALDSENTTWKAYGNRYWPRQALVHDGEIVWQHVGESSLYDLEEEIARILDIEKRGADLSHRSPRKDISPEEYLGHKRCRGVNDSPVFRGEKELEAPRYRKKENVYLDGRWNMAPEHLEAVEDSRLFYGFSGKEANVVAHPNDGIRDIEVFLDGSKVDEKDAGVDLRVEDDRSYVRVKSPDMYNVIDTDHRDAEITLVPEKKTRLFTLTFG